MTSEIPLVMGAEECGKGDRCGSGDVPVMFGPGAVRAVGGQLAGVAEHRPSLIRGSSGCAPATTQRRTQRALDDGRHRRDRSITTRIHQASLSDEPLTNGDAPTTHLEPPTRSDGPTQHGPNPPRRSTSRNDPSNEQSRARLHWKCAGP
jgi:hypothetical protein